MKALRFALPAAGALALGAMLGTATLVFAQTPATPTASSSPLTIGNLRVSNIDARHATVKWHTNAPADSKVKYGTTTAYGSTLADSAYVSDHTLVLRDLATSTTYHFRVISTDGTDRAASADDTFTTASSSGQAGTSTVSTTITHVRSTNIGPTHALIKWHTDQLADSKVQYGTTTAYGATAADAAMEQSHELALSGLMPDTLYHYRVISSNDNGTTRSGDYTLMTQMQNGGGGGGLPAPTLLSPADGTIETSAEQQYASWSSVASNATSSVTYVYQVANASSTDPDGSFTDPVYTSDPLSTTTIATPNTPEGTYFWHVQASDQGGDQSDWSATWEFTIDNGSNAGAPMVSDVAATDIGTGGATITWNTDQAASSQVFYGTTANYGSSTPLDSGLVTSHSVDLSGLAAGTTYHYMVESTNGNGTGTSSDGVFTTATSSNSVALALLGIDTVRGTASADGSFADGFEWIFHFVVPTDESQFAMSFSDFWNTADASDTIPAANDIRYYSAQSDNATTSDSAVLITAADQYPSTMLDLTGDASSTSDGRQADIVVQMAVPQNTVPGSYLGNWNAESTTTASSTP
ncbi:MAG TPA: fibronectin type III domain-containing protein [Candidatus Paceibacterota bacterium]|nr:fibronectin type III domain-containing protein [Candidatus Paceibacterota bacterium]